MQGDITPHRTAVETLLTIAAERMRYQLLGHSQRETGRLYPMPTALHGIKAWFTEGGDNFSLTTTSSKIKNSLWVRANGS